MLFLSLGACLEDTEGDDPEASDETIEFCDAHRDYLMRCPDSAGCVTDAINVCTRFGEATGSVYKKTVARNLDGAECTDAAFDDARLPDLLDTQPTAGQQRIANRYCQSCRNDTFQCLEDFFISDGESFTELASFVMPLSDLVSLRLEQQCTPISATNFSQCDVEFQRCAADFWAREMPLNVCGN